MTHIDYKFLLLYMYSFLDKQRLLSLYSYSTLKGYFPMFFSAIFSNIGWVDSLSYQMFRRKFKDAAINLQDESYLYHYQFSIRISFIFENIYFLCYFAETDSSPKKILVENFFFPEIYVINSLSFTL